ncbi:MAG: hypothetical protein WD960_08485 [Gemmatimonadota bacterium]
MSKMVQIRDVPDDLHAELVRRAGREGLTLTDYLQRLLEREVARPTPEELRERLASRRAVELDRPVADVLREERAKR